MTRPLELTPPIFPTRSASMETTMRFGPGVCARCGINHGPRTCEEYQSGLDIKSFDEPAPDTAPGITDEEMALARILAELDGNDAEEIEILFVEPKYKILERERDRYIGKAQKLLAAMRAVASRTRPATPAPDANALTVDAEGWATVRVLRALYIDEGNAIVACDRIPSPVTLLLKFAEKGERIPKEETL